MYKLYIKENTSTNDLLNQILEEKNVKSEIIYNEYGKPYLKNNEFYFNMSNSGKYTICAISDKEIGVDIQKIKLKENIIDKICTEEEKKIINNADDFTKIWVKKESYVKYLGKGLSHGLKNVDTLKLHNINVIKSDDYYIAICFNN